MAHVPTHRIRRSFGRLVTSVFAPSALLAALAVLLLGPGSAAAQAASVSITSLTCDASPEAVRISNSGSSSVDLNGWTLVSDPSTETFDLTAIGTLSAGSSVFINSGSGAAGAFVWSTSEVFRNGDATDFARIVDADGVTVGTVNCTAATPPPNVMPSGGGPPGGSSSLAIGAIAAAAGGALLALTIITGLAWMGVGAVTGRGRRRRGTQEDGTEPVAADEPVDAAIIAEPRAEAPAEAEPAATAKISEPPRQADPNLWPYIFVVLGAIVAALVIVLALSGGPRKK